MRKNRDHGDLIALAICVSVVLHALAMFFAAPRVMSRALLSSSDSQRDRRQPMSVKRYTVDPLLERKRTLPKTDSPAVKKAPLAESVSGKPDVATESAAPANIAPSIPMPKIISAPDVKAELPTPSAPPKTSVPEPPQFFTVAPSPQIPVQSTPPSLPAFDSKSMISPAGIEPAAASYFELPESIGKTEQTMAGIEPYQSAPKSSYVFNNRVLDDVDADLVEKEKAAVRELLSVPEAAPAESAIEYSFSACIDPAEPQWRYFKIVFSPKRGIDALPVIPKDAVILMDASGSIGSDRIIRCRNATKAILRSCMNSGDRFNLVAFRNRFSYAFREWRECNADSFAAADKWLSSLTAHGRTDVFSTISSVLTLPRDPARPVIALVITDGDANEGVKETAEILSKFTALNDGLISVYMYGVKREANAKLINLLTRGNRGESFIHTGSRRRADKELEPLAQAFRDPVLTDLRIQFTAYSQVETYPQRLKNLYKGRTVEICGRCPATVDKLVFSLKGLSGTKAYDSLYRLEFHQASPAAAGLPAKWHGERSVARLLAQ
jgi:Ca-activated chloride channel family protein